MHKKNNPNSFLLPLKKPTEIQLITKNTKTPQKKVRFAFQIAPNKFYRIYLTFGHFTGGLAVAYAIVHLLPVGVLISSKFI